MSKLLALSVAVVVLSAASLYAATPATGAGTTANHGANFVDKDGDGLCDNVGTRQGTGKGTKANFVDANKDGVCDNAGTKKGSGQGMKRGQGKGKGCCAGQGSSK